MVEKNKFNDKSVTIVIIAAVSLLIFYIDTLTPRGYLDWFFYMALIFYSSIKLPRSYLIIFGIISIMFGIGGFFLSPPGIPVEFALVNRIIGILILWMTTTLLYYRTKDLESTDEIIQQLKTVIEKISSGVIYFDLDGKMIMVNRNFSNILGYKPNELLNKNILGLIHPDYRKEFLEIKEKIILGLLKRDYIEAIMTKKTGEVILVNISLNIPEDIPKASIIAFVQDYEQKENEEVKIYNILKERELLLKELPY